MYDLALYPNINRIWSALIIDTFTHNNIDTFFTSPGLRNAPLLAAVQLNDKAVVHSGLDERSMSYKALGYAKATGKTAVLICTSGTALANYLPAIIEAYKTSVPLLVLSADRPQLLVETGDNQSINQKGIFGQYSCSELYLGVPDSEMHPQELINSIKNLLSSSVQKGPLHLNVPFEEPLDKTIDPNCDQYLSKLQDLTFELSDPLIKTNKLQLPVMDKSDKTLIVVGPMPEYQSKLELKEFLINSDLPCLLDIGSGLKFSEIPSSRILPSFEHPEIIKLLTKNKPDLIIHIGGRLVSKHYYRFLKEHPEVKLLLVGNKDHFTHPAPKPTWNIDFTIERFIQKITDDNYLKKQAPYTFDCKEIVGLKETIIERGAFSFPLISKRIVEGLPEFCSLYLGNSTSIRSFDAFTSNISQNKRINVLTHRGASGIEGFNAAALGYAEVSKCPTVLVHGDIGFMHDLGSLLMYKNKKVPLTNIVINNKGGGIFKHLPIANDHATLPLITTEHELDFEGFCLWLGIAYKKVDNILDFEIAFNSSLNSNSITIIEAQIDQDENLKVYQQLKTLKL